MPTTTHLIAAVYRTTGMAVSTLAELVAILREAGHIAKTKRGRGATPVTPMAASNLALALLLPGLAAIREPDPIYGASRFLAAANLEMHPAALCTYEARDAINALGLADGEPRFGAWMDGIVETLIDDPSRAFCVKPDGSLTHLSVSLQDAGPVARIVFQPHQSIANHEISFEFRSRAIPWNAGSLGTELGSFQELEDIARTAEMAARFSTVTLTARLFEELAACFRDKPDTS
jgi:hypothetical protein